MQGEMLGITGYQTAHPYVAANVVLMHARGQLVLEIIVHSREKEWAICMVRFAIEFQFWCEDAPYVIGPHLIVERNT